MIQQIRYDPRTVARNIPGIFNSILPQLTPGVVAHLNRTSQPSDCTPISPELVKESSLQNAMLFEFSFVAAEQILNNSQIDWNQCLQIAVSRQKQYFDAQLPDEISTLDKHIAELVGTNISTMISKLALDRRCPVSIAPHIPGYQWIASGNGDFAIGPTLIEVKCSSRNFSAPDYRQIIIYWLLSYAASIEHGTTEWTEGILLNPRSATFIIVNFDELLHVISAGRTKADILLLFSGLIGESDKHCP